MSVQNPPTQIVPIYNSTNFLIATEGLSISTGDNRYYKLSGGILSGLMTANAGINSVGPISISDTTQSTSRTTGSLVVSGGLGVSLDTHMNNLHLNASSSELKISGVNGYLNINNNTNASTSSSSGALQCAGGAYFGGNSIMNANLQVNTITATSGANAINFSNSSGTFSTTTGAVTLGGATTFNNRLLYNVQNVITGNTTIDFTTDKGSTVLVPIAPSGSSSITITLPAISANPSNEFYFVNINNTGVTTFISVNNPATEMFDNGLTTISLSSQYDRVRLTSLFNSSSPTVRVWLTG